MRYSVHTTGFAMQKAERQKLILDVISARPIKRQDELADVLRDSGFSVTQASISRDLDEMGIVKIDGRYAHIELPVAEASPFGVSAIESAGENLIVVRCSSGLASAAAVRIDGAKVEGIVGTIAGDDTIFVAVNDAHDQRAVMKKLRMIFATG
jgi:transcriptional regulator of arginine metabolism